MSKIDDLRGQAEKLARENATHSPEDLVVLSPEETQKILHELRVHQIELEMQNEELRRTQSELVASQARYFDLYDLAPVGYCTISEKSLILEANLTAATLLGVSRSALVRQPITRFIFKEDQDVYYLHRKRLFETGEPQTCDLRMLAQDGTVFWAHLAATAARNPSSGTGQMNHGDLVCRIVMSDISQRKQAEEALRESLSLIAAVVENIPLMIFLKESTDLRFVVFNRAGEELLGYDRKDFLGKNNLDLFPPEQAAHFMAKDREVLDGETGVLDIPEEPILTAGKGERLLHTRKVCIRGADGATKYLLGISEDITDRKRAEEERTQLQAQLSQSQKMESIGRLAGGVAHDFNNMLMVILGHVELLLDSMNPTHSLYADLQEIRSAAERSADLTRKLLAFARKQIIAPSVLDLNDSVEGMLKMLRRMIGEDIDLTWRPGKGLWSVSMDPSQLDQILVNLCVNARDALAGVGKVIIETNTAVFDSAYCDVNPECVPGDFVMLAVSDNGCGMDKQTMRNVFEPFFTTKEMGKGTGLGLATVYGIVKQNNGFINVYSEPDRGTTFKLYLPRYKTSDEQMQTEVVTENTARGIETILLVEDELSILRLTTTLLERQGYKVLTAIAPGEAIRVAEEFVGPIHLLITDVVMPEMNGRDLATSLLSIFPDIKCLYMSGYTAEIIAHQGVLDEGVYFIQKPFSIKNLAAKVRQALGE